MGALDTIRGAIGRLTARSIESGTPGVEGQPKQGPWYILNQDGWLPDSWGYMNFWQMDLDPLKAGSSAIVEACIAAYAQTISQCPGDHWRGTGDGGRERVTTSALSRVLRRPNEYQSRSDFMLDLVSDLYRDGNTYALATRNDRFEVTAFHPFDPRQCKPIIAPNGDVFYELIGNNIVERIGSDYVSNMLRTRIGLLVPARDVLHVKLEPERTEPLIGIPPTRHAAAAIAAQQAIAKQLVNLFGNQTRPAGVIETEQNLSKEQVVELRKLFNDVWKGVDNLNIGPPILTNGFKFRPVSMTAKDAETVLASKLTQDEIFAVFGVPPAILGLTDKSNVSSTEALMQFWLARGLGFAINHVEVAFDHFFGLRGWPDEYVEMDTRALLRVAYKDRIEALARGVQTAIYTPNEARRSEDLPDKDGGDEPRVQQQQVPLDWGGFDVEPPAPEAPSAPASPEAEPEDKPAEETDDEKAAKEYFIGAVLRRAVRGVHDVTTG